MSMSHVDENRLANDASYRFGYLAEFIGFGKDDIDAIHASACHLAPLVPTLVDEVYDRLFSYDATKRHFVSRQSGYDGPVPQDIDTLSVDHPMIAFRKQHLGRYLSRLVTGRYDSTMVEYLDMVGRIHTSGAGSPDVNVPLVQMNALLGFVATAIVATIMAFHLDRETETRTLLAFNRLLWIQNDFISRHYLSAAS